MRPGRLGQRWPEAVAADQDQRGPAVEIDPPFERQAAIGRDGGIGLGRQQAGQNDTRAGRGEPRERRGEALQRPQQDIGEDEIVGRALAQFWSGDAVRLYHLDETAGAIERDIGAGRAHGAAVDVGCEHGPPQGAGGGDGEHARAGAEVEDAPSRQRFAKPIERQQAAARGAVMAGAEGQRRFDLDADAVVRDAGAVMGAVHDEAAGGDGRQSGEAFAHPIFGRDALEAQRFGGSVACGRGGQRAYYFFVGRDTKIHRHPPAAGADIHKADGNFVGRQSLGDKIGNPVRRLFIGFEECNGGR